MKNAVFMGTPDFAKGILNALLESEYQVTAVFTQPDRPKGRGKQVQSSPVKELALLHGIPVYQPLKIRTEENAALLQQLRPDFIIVAAFGQIIPQKILDIPRYGCLNVHASLLPKYRGAAPIQWAILDGEKETGVTIMRMNAGLDTGDIIEQAVVPISEDETGGSLFDKLMEEGAKQILSAMRSVEAGTAVYTPQPEESPTRYASMLDKHSGLIDWGQSADRIRRQVQAMNPWPSAYSHLDGRMLKIWAAEALPGSAGKDTQAVPGTVLRADKTGFHVQTGDGILSLKEVQPEGKKRMASDAFLRGCRKLDGETLG